MLEKLFGVKYMSQETRDIATLWILFCMAITLICIGYIFFM